MTSTTIRCRLHLFVLAYNVDNVQRRLALPASVQNWRLTTIGVKLIRTVAKVVHHTPYVTYQMADVQCRGRFFR